MQSGMKVGGGIVVGVVALATWTVQAAPPDLPVATHIVRVPAGGDLNAFGLQPIRSIDYGAFQWLELSVEDFARLGASGIPFQEQDEAFVLRLGEAEFDPAAGVPQPPAGWALDRPEGPGLHMVQFAGPTRDEWLDHLQNAGWRIVQYIPPHTYVVWGESEARDEIHDLESAVRWTGSFSPAYRVHPAWQGLDQNAQDVKVLLYRAADATNMIGELEALGGRLTGRRVLNETFEIAGFTLPGDQFAAAARLPGVYSIQVVPTDGGLRGEMSDQVNVNNVAPNNQAFPGYLNWLASVNLSGGGVVIANVDGGVQNNHPDLVGRLIACSGSTCGGSAQSSHGTHTAGIMAADGSSGVTDGFGFLRGLGMAPGANLVEQVYSPTFTQPGGMRLLMTQSYNNGAQLSGNSWGPAGTPRGYDDDTMQVDIGVRDADPNAPGNQPLTYVLSFMNGYGGTSSQGTPDEAKNIFNIGSTKMQTSGGSQILDINDLSSNSAHGPALDGRKIPHMVAPGCDVDSTVTGSSYGLLCGTSMASPHVSGAVALFIEYYRNLPDNPPDPSPALVKAAFLAVARDLAGFHDADGGILGHPFDSKQGWGRMDAEAVLDPQVSVRYFDNPTIFDSTGETWEVTVSPADPAEPMRLMLVWTDAPGHGLGGSTPAWNNDLDLVVQAGADTYYGNRFGPSGWSATGGVADGINNTEGVFLGPTPPSAITIQVVAADINSDGIPNYGDGTDQDFALVCYNCAEEPGFTLTVTPAAQDVCAPADAVYDVDIGVVLGFDEPVTLSAAGAPGGTTVDFSVNPVNPPGMSTLTIGNTGAAPDGQSMITVEGTAPSLSRSAVVQLTLVQDAPEGTTLVSPVNGAANVSLTPTFTWAASAGAVEYELQIAGDAAFNDVVVAQGGIAETSYALETALGALTPYWWRVRASNACGSGPMSAAYMFTTEDVPAILLVDDDDNDPDVRSYYTGALDAIGFDYDVWDTNNTDNEPSTIDLAPYSMVIWFTGDEFGGTAGPAGPGEGALADFLEDGNCVFMTSQDYYFDRGLTTFMSTYLGVASMSSDVAQTTVTGTGPVFNGMGPYALSYPFSNYSDRVTPAGSGVLAFAGNEGDAAVTKEAAGYRSIFWGFPFEAVAAAGDRNSLMQAAVAWCGAGVVEAPLPSGLVERNRYVSFLPNSGTKLVAYQLELISSADFPASTVTKWIDGPDINGFARLTDTRTERVWRQSVVNVSDCEIVPAATYEIRTTPDGVEFSEPLVVSTTHKPDKEWADCVGEFDGVQWLAPDGSVNFNDVQAAIGTFEQSASAVEMTWVDMDGQQPNQVVNMTDIQMVILAFEGASYPFSDPVDCP